MTIRRNSMVKIDDKISSSSKKPVQCVLYQWGKAFGRCSFYWQPAILIDKKHAPSDYTQRLQIHKKRKSSTKRKAAANPRQISRSWRRRVTAEFKISFAAGHVWVELTCGRLSDFSTGLCKLRVLKLSTGLIPRPGVFISRGSRQGSRDGFCVANQHKKAGHLYFTMWAAMVSWIRKHPALEGKAAP